MVKKKEPKKIEKNPAKRVHVTPCVNTDCKLRKQGCRGFEGCPGYKARE